MGNHASTKSLCKLTESKETNSWTSYKNFRHWQSIST